jgi:hypothetical protein
MGSSRRALQARVDELEARVAQLVAERGGAGPAVGEASPAEEVRDRRAFLRMAGVGAAAAAGGLLASARPAAAVDPQDIDMNTTNTATSQTTVTGAFDAPVLQIQNTASTANARAVLAMANRSGIGTIRADNPAGGGYGVVGNAVNGADFQAFGSGIYAMQPHLNAVGTFHRVGDIYHENGTVQACIAQGTPGTLRILAGPNTAGSLHVLASTVRIYDSRPNQPPFAGVKAPLAQAEERVVAATQGGAAPAGATAVMVNLTVVSQSPSGFLSAFRNGVAWPGNSSINWERQGQVIANSAVVAVDANAQFRVRASFATDVIIDVVGYYR